MSQAEFELYLSLLGRFLRLNAAQRAEIADELRDHLETRLDELKSLGLTHDDAVAKALHEFGDASELATHFTQLAKQRRRRLIMRSMYASAGAATAVILLMWGLMRTPEPRVEPQVVAQQDIDIEKAAEMAVSSQLERRYEEAAQEYAAGKSEIEQKLATPLDHLDFNEIPLRDVLTFIGDHIKADIVFADEGSLQETGEDSGDIKGAPVTLSLQHTVLEASAALELILENATGRLMTYSVRDGYIFVHPASQRRENLTIEIYNVRDLLQGVRSTMRYEPDQGAAMMGRGPMAAGPMAGRRPMAGRGAVGGGPMAGRGGPAAGRGPMVGDMAMGGAMGPASGSDGELSEVAPAEALIRVVIAATGDAWAQNGTGNGTIEEFGGLLVVRQSDETHREIHKLLEMLRDSKSKLDEVPAY